MKNVKIKKMCFSAMFAAMIFGLTMLHIPIGAGGYIHIGDALIYITALLMGGPWAFLSAAIGAAVADIVSGFAVYAIPSMIIKMLIAVPFALVSKKEEKLLSARTALLTIPSGAVTILGYFIADLILYREGAVADLIPNLIQAVGSGIVFIVLALALDKVKIREALNNFIKE